MDESGFIGKLIIGLGAIISFLTTISAITSRLQTKKNCEACQLVCKEQFTRNDERFKKNEKDIKENEKIINEIRSDIKLILDKVSTFVSAFDGIKSSMKETDNEINVIVKDVSTLKAAERFRQTGSFIKD